MSSKVTKKITSCYCINLRRAANSVTSYYDSVLESLGITITQYSLLSSLKKLGNCTVSDLAIHVGLERTTVVRTLKPLFTKKLIEDISEEGQRNRNLQLTKAGYEILEQAKPLWENAQKKLEEDIGIDEMDFLVRIAAKLAK